MSKIDCKDYICRPFCKWFKEGEKEEMECQGAVVIEELIRNGRLKKSSLPKSGKDPELWEKKNLLIQKVVCSHCPFLIGGCDFQTDEPPPGSDPCGGYILLSKLFKEDVDIEALLEELEVE